MFCAPEPKRNQSPGSIILIFTKRYHTLWQKISISNTTTKKTLHVLLSTVPKNLIRKIRLKQFNVIPTGVWYTCVINLSWPFSKSAAGSEKNYRLSLSVCFIFLWALSSFWVCKSGTRTPVFATVWRKGSIPLELWNKQWVSLQLLEALTDQYFPYFF